MDSPARFASRFERDEPFSRSDTEVLPVSEEKATNAQVAECLDMALAARRKAHSALSPAEERFWRRMEERWLHLAETYRETKQLTDGWLLKPNAQIRARLH